MMTTQLLRRPNPQHPLSRRLRRRLARSASPAEALGAFANGMAELAPAQPFALYLLRKGRFEAVTSSRADGWASFAGTCSLVRYLRAHPHPVMTRGTRRARCLTSQLDRDDLASLARSEAVAVIPVLESSLLVGFVELAQRDAASREASADPMAVAELTDGLAARLTELHAQHDPAQIVRLRVAATAS